MEQCASLGCGINSTVPVLAKRNASTVAVLAVPTTEAEASFAPWLVRPMEPVRDEAGIFLLSVLDKLDAVESLGRSIATG